MTEFDSNLYSINSKMDDFANFIRGGPAGRGSEFKVEFHERLQIISDIATFGSSDISNLPALRAACLHKTACEMNHSTIIRHGRSKPYGYSGDFQMIDLTYLKALPSLSDRGRAWDTFYHEQIAPIAVCNRKHRFETIIAEIANANTSRPLRILNVGSGPAREIIDGAHSAGLEPSDLQVICVDIDPHAIAYARAILGPKWEASVHFVQRNALRYRPNQYFDLAWSAGLFDYLDGRLAGHLLRTMWSVVSPGGRLVIGNFADTHSTRPWIEWCGDWMLIHRSLLDMEKLAKEITIDDISDSIVHEIDEHEAIRFFTVYRGEESMVK